MSSRDNGNNSKLAIRLDDFVEHFYSKILANFGGLFCDIENVLVKLDDYTYLVTWI